MALPAFQLEVGGSVEEARSLAHEAMDKWFDQLVPMFEGGKEPTISELSHQFSNPGVEKSPRKEAWLRQNRLSVIG